MSVDLRTTYLGLKLANPLVVAACPLTDSLDSLKRLAVTTTVPGLAFCSA